MSDRPRTLFPSRTPPGTALAVLAEREGLTVDRGEHVAVFSPCRLYRYALTFAVRKARGRGPVEGPPGVFLMLNPSTVDADRLDPTLTRCRNFARLWNWSTVTVVNIFAWRSTDPAGMKAAADPVGPANDAAILAAVRAADGLAVAGWGVHGEHRGRSGEVLAMLAGEGVDPLALRVTKAGHPGHPLYVPGRTPPLPLSRFPKAAR